MIRFFNVTKSYRKNTAALDNVSFEIAKGDFVYLTGPSGAGKSTLLKLLYRAEIPTRGQILINGQNVGRMTRGKVPQLRRQLGIVFQDFKLLNSQTVFENVAFPLEVQGRKRLEVGKRVYQVLKFVGLESRLHSRPLELSGGEQQRVAIARALVNEPMLLVADEPTGNLDPEMSREVLRLFREVNAAGTTVLIASHDRQIIQEFPGRVLRLEKGRIVDSPQVPSD